jgi:uncharacterized membrane protein YhaH (DUF805 family)
MHYYTDAFKKYAEFSGRATRTQYWMFVLWNLVVSIVIGILAPLIFSENIANIIGYLYLLAVIIPSLAILARRLHDIDRSGWWILIGFVPLIGAIVLIIFAVLDSTPGTNSYGPNPKGVTAPVAPAP